MWVAGRAGPGGGVGPVAREVGAFEVGPQVTGGAEERVGGSGDVGGADRAGVGRAGIGMDVAREVENGGE